MSAEIIGVIVALLAALALLVRAFAFLVKANAKARETAAEIQFMRVDIEKMAQKRADDIEDRLLTRLERETELSNQKIAELDKLYRETRHALDETQRELEAVKDARKRAEEERARVRDDLDASNIRIGVLEADREKDKLRIKELEEKNTTLTLERDELQKIIAQMGKEIGVLTKRESELTDKVDKLEKSFQMIQHAQVLGATELVEEILEEVKGMKDAPEKSGKDNNDA